MEKNSVCADQIQLTTPVSKFLLGNSERILREWETRVRKEIAGAEALARPILIDTLPVFISNLAQALDAHHPRALATDSSTVAQEHGGERARVTTFGPAMILKEYQILRDVLLKNFEDHSLSNSVIFNIVYKSFDQAIQEAMTAYFLVHKNLRDQFVATLTHDLRTPIGAAKLASDMLVHKLGEDQTSGEARRLEALALKISRNLLRTDRMVQYLLDSSQVQAGERLSLTLSAGELGGLLTQITEDLSPADRARLEIHAKVVTVYADIPLLRRAIENLLSNALKYSPEKTVVAIKVSECLGRALVSVHNEGVAIPVDEQGRIFQTFQRSAAASSGGQRGWGLGLAFVRAVCESHGGSVGVDSAPESGTTFTLDIPANGHLIEDGHAKT